MNTHYYYKNSTEWQEERQLLSQFPIEVIRLNIKEYGWEFVSGTTNVPISVLNRLFIYDYQEIPKVAKISNELLSKIIKLNNGNEPYWVRKDSIAFMPDEFADVESTFLSDKYYGRINFAFLYSDYKKYADSCPRSVTVYSLALSDFNPSGPYKQVPDRKSQAYAPSTAVDWKAECASFDSILRMG